MGASNKGFVAHCASFVNRFDTIPRYHLPYRLSPTSSYVQRSRCVPSLIFHTPSTNALPPQDLQFFFTMAKFMRWICLPLSRLATKRNVYSDLRESVKEYSSGSCTRSRCRLSHFGIRIRVDGQTLSYLNQPSWRRGGECIA